MSKGNLLIGIRLPEGVNSRLEEVVVKTGMTKQEILRVLTIECLDMWLVNRGVNTFDKRKEDEGNSEVMEFCDAVNPQTLVEGGDDNE